MTEDRIMLTGHKRGSETSRVALNDIVIHRKGNLQILSLNVYVNGEFLNNYHADGIIVATPTVLQATVCRREVRLWIRRAI